MAGDHEPPSDKLLEEVENDAFTHIAGDTAECPLSLFQILAATEVPQTVWNEQVAGEAVRSRLRLCGVRREQIPCA